MKSERFVSRCLPAWHWLAACSTDNFAWCEIPRLCSSLYPLLCSSKKWPAAGFRVSPSRLYPPDSHHNLKNITINILMPLLRRWFNRRPLPCRIFERALSSRFHLPPSFPLSAWQTRWNNRPGFKKTPCQTRSGLPRALTLLTESLGSVR